MPDWIPIDRLAQIGGWRDMVDIAVVAFMGWLAIGMLRRTRARNALVGLLVLAGVYLVASNLQLRLTAALFQGFFAAVVIVLIVIFQDDLRRVFEQIGSWRGRDASAPAGNAVLDLLVRTVARLAETRTGALIVLPGQEPLDRHLEGGIALDGRVSEPLLLSLFDASSPGHDGAVLLRGSRVERFAVHLPLSSNHAALGPGGTRHAAALGLSERCDALAIAVSEERGTVSLARDGTMRVLRRPQDLAAELRERFTSAPGTHHFWQGRPARDAAIAIVGAIALWLVLIPGSDVGEATVEATIAVSNLPADLAVESIDPPSVEVRLRGLRRDLVFAGPREVSIQIDAYLARLGRRTFAIESDDVRVPEGVSVVAISSDRVRLDLRAATPLP